MNRRRTLAWPALLVVGTAAAAGTKIPSKLPPAEERGEELYLENCWHCHGKRALGDGPLAAAGPVKAPPLAGRVPDDREAWTTAIHRGQDTMPAFAPVFDRSAARSILVWLDALDPETGDGPSIEEARKKTAEKAAEKAAEKKAAAKSKPPPDDGDDAGEDAEGTTKPAAGSDNSPAGGGAPAEAPSTPGSVDEQP